MTIRGEVKEAVIRPFEVEDRPACLDLFDSNVPRYFLPQERAEFAAFLDALPGPYVVLEDGSARVLGCGGYALADGGRRADLCWGMVHGDHHRRGLGRRLAHHRISKARSHPGVEKVVLRTSQLTTGFYRSMGFETVAVDPDGFGPGLDEHEMSLVVAGAVDELAGGPPASS